MSTFETTNDSTPALLTDYASFAKRFLAYFADSVILGIPFFLLAYAVRSNIIDLVWLVAFWLYFGVQESSPYQATLGKRLLGIYVVDIEGNRITLGRALLRALVKTVSQAVIFGVIGFVMALFTPRKQALHDLIANTLVLNR